MVRDDPGKNLKSYNSFGQYSSDIRFGAFTAGQGEAFEAEGSSDLDGRAVGLG